MKQVKLQNVLCLMNVRLFHCDIVGIGVEYNMQCVSRNNNILVSNMLNALLLLIHFEFIF